MTTKRESRVVIPWKRATVFDELTTRGGPRVTLCGGCVTELPVASGLVAEQIYDILATHRINCTAPLVQI